jgi:hypothetical protein
MVLRIWFLEIRVPGYPYIEDPYSLPSCNHQLSRIQAVSLRASITVTIFEFSAGKFWRTII